MCAFHVLSHMILSFTHHYTSIPIYINLYISIYIILYHIFMVYMVSFAVLPVQADIFWHFLAVSLGSGIAMAAPSR